jgi:hypothetical protein
VKHDMTNLGALAPLFAVPTDRLAAEVRTAATLYRRSSWELALLLYRLDEAGKATPNLTAWCKTHLAMPSSQASKYRQAAESLLAAPPEKRPAFIAIGAIQFYESGLCQLAKTAPAKAARVARAGGTQKAMREKVRTVSGRKPPKQATPPPRETIGADGIRWALTAVKRATGGLYFSLAIDGATRRALRDLSSGALADEILTLVDALGIRAAVEARLRRRAA